MGFLVPQSAAPAHLPMEGFWQRSCSCNARAQYQPRGRRPRDKQLGCLVLGGNGLRVPAVAFDVGGGGVGTGTFHPNGEARKQEENHSRVLVPRAPFQPDQVWLLGLISISDQLFRLPEAWAGCGVCVCAGMGMLLPSWTGVR